MLTGSNSDELQSPDAYPMRYCSTCSCWKGYLRMRSHRYWEDCSIYASYSGTIDLPAIWYFSRYQVKCSMYFSSRGGFQKRCDQVTLLTKSFILILIIDNTFVLCRVLVLVPTRELGVQVYQVTKQLAQFTRIDVGLSVGGLDLKAQVFPVSLKLISTFSPNVFIIALQTEFYTFLGSVSSPVS